MAQYISTPIHFNNVRIDNIIQHSQINYHCERVIEISWDSTVEKTFVQNNGQYFYMYSPDIQYFTIRDVLKTLHIAHEQIVLVWTEQDNHCVENILDTHVKDVVINQLAIYPVNVRLPNRHFRGHLPMVAI